MNEDDRSLVKFLLFKWDGNWCNFRKEEIKGNCICYTILVTLAFGITWTLKYLTKKEGMKKK